MTEDKDKYRDKIATVDDKGKRIWVYPKKPKGPFYNKRKIVSYFLLIFLFGAPHLKINGQPFLMFNILERKFSIFGKMFWPQDFHLFALAMIAGIIFVALFTVVFGRLFCGWVCPQTIFMEMFFRRMEYLIEGDWTSQKKLNNSPWTKEKIFKKVSKHTLFWIFSFLIANTFLAYIIGSDELWKIQREPLSEHVGGLSAIVIFTTIFYLVFSQMREQVCTVICPYGRLQGVLLDNKSIIVAYDYVRGEERAKFKKGEERTLQGKGDCIDCNQCVNVCPTGIDIRNGTQLECTNCTACMDACDYMMENVGLEKGLIRYASEEGIKNKTPIQFTAKAKAYSAVLLVILGVLSVLIIGRSDFEATVLRTRGTLYHELNDGSISNIYDISLVNKTNEDYPVEIKLLKGSGEIKIVGENLFLEGQTELKGKLMILRKEDEVTQMSEKIVIGIYRDGKLIEKAKTTFEGPAF